MLRRSFWRDGLFPGVPYVYLNAFGLVPPTRSGGNFEVITNYFGLLYSVRQSILV